MLGTDKFPGGASFLYLSDRILITGGVDAVKNAFYYVINSRSCEYLPSMIGGHEGHVSVIKDSMVFIISGKDEHDEYTNSCERFDMIGENWMQIEEITLARTYASGNCVGENIYVTGGDTTEGTTDSIERYNIP